MIGQQIVSLCDDVQCSLKGFCGGRMNCEYVGKLFTKTFKQLGNMGRSWNVCACVRDVLLIRSCSRHDVCSGGAFAIVVCV